MGGAHFPCSTSRHAHLFSFVLLLLSSTQMKNSLVEGRRQLAKASEVITGGKSEKMVMERAVIGSRPPRCEEKCTSCGHCEAIQVPLLPQQKEKRTVKGFSATVNSKADGAYGSNYKPMNWKCKCGGVILNP